MIPFQTSSVASGICVYRRDVGAQHMTGATLTPLIFASAGFGATNIYFPLTNSRSTRVEVDVSVKGASFTWFNTLSAVFARDGASVVKSVGISGPGDTVGNVPAAVGATLGFSGISWIVQAVGASGAASDVFASTSLLELP